jgi:DamX protein
MAAAEISSFPFFGTGSADGGSPSLISDARAQAFDMLLHLSMNLSQPIVLCGPEGIGKSVFLRLLEKRAESFATVCYLAASPGMSFERVLDEVRHRASQEPQEGPVGAAPAFDAADLLTAYAKSNRSLLLLLDDAEVLLPGLLNALWQFARLYPALKLIFALRPDEFRRKCGTDALAVGEAFVLEIPALARAESDTYALGLTAGKAGSESLGEDLLRHVYARTLGVPGLIRTVLDQPLPEPQQAAFARKWVPLAGIGLSVALAVAGAALFWSGGPEPAGPGLPDAGVEPRVAPLPVQPEPAASLPQDSANHPARGANADVPPAPAATPEVELPVVAPLAEAPAAESMVPPVVPEAKPNPEPPPPAIPETPRQTPPPLSEPLAPQAVSAVQEGEAAPQGEPGSPAAAAVPPPVAAAPAAEGGTAPPVAPAPADEAGQSTAPSVGVRVYGEDWLLAQDPAAYTLQIVAVGQASLLDRVVARFPEGTDLASFRSRKGRGDLFPLFYGVYPDMAAARAAAAKLPRDLGQPFARQFKSVRQEIEKMAALNARTARSVSPASVAPAVRPQAAPVDAAAVGNVPIPGPAAKPAVQSVPPAPEPVVKPAVPESAPSPPPGGQGEPAVGAPPRAESAPPATGAGKQAVTEPAGTAGLPPAPASPVAGMHGADWLLAQDPNAYTLQIVAVSHESSIARIAGQFPEGSVLATYRSLKGRSEVFPLFYGLYPDEAAARSAAAKLPYGLGKPFPRQLKTIQREIGKLVLRRYGSLP